MPNLGRYELLRELGRGGMASVYLARDPLIDRRVAIKVLSSQLTREADFRARFQREALIIARLEHPCIVPIYDFGEETGQLFIVMRHLPGGSLLERMTGRPFPWPDAMAVVERVAEALEAAHRQGVLHRDLKPGNVLFDDDHHAFLSDFGIARLLTGTAYTQAGIMGTPEYMSPEQAEGLRELDARSDVYSLAVLAYQMLAGHLPFSADTPVQVMYQHVHSAPPALDTRRLGLPAECQKVLARALAKQPEARYASALEMARALKAAHPRPRPQVNVSVRLAEAASPTRLVAPVAGAAPPPRTAARPGRRFILAGLMIALPALALAAGLALPGVKNMATNTPTNTTTAIATNTPAASPSATATQTATATATNTATNTPTDTATSTPAATRQRQPSPTAPAPLPTPTTAPAGEQPAPQPSEPAATAPPPPELSTPTPPPMPPA